MGEVYYGAIQKWGENAFTHPSSSPRNANTFLFSPTSEIGLPGGYLASPLLEQIYSLCGGGWMGVAELCIGRGAVAGRATFYPLTKNCLKNAAWLSK